MAERKIWQSKDVGTQLARGPMPLVRWTPSLFAGSSILAAVVLVAFIAPVMLSGAADDLSSDVKLDPSWVHPLGTDSFGRDLLSRALVATRLSLLMTVGATGFSIVIGLFVGMQIWLASARVRNIATRVLDIAVSYPAMLVAVVIAAILGAGVWQLVLAIGVANVPAFARLTANLSASVFQRDHVTTARLLGVPNRLIMTKHLLPNMSEPLLVDFASSFSTGLVAMSALSFVGLGVQPPQYDLGSLLAAGIPSIYSRPVEVAGPTSMIVLISFSAMLIGDGLAASADPRSSRRRKARRTFARVAPTRPSLPDAQTSLVSIKNLSVRRSDGHPLVRSVSFTIAKGEILGVVGESGSGKSLMAMSLAQLLPDGMTVAADELVVDGMDMTQPQSRRQLATTLALIYQDPGTTFNPVLQMGAQLTEVPRLHIGRTRLAARASITQALRTVHLAAPERILKAHPYALSGGMRQRAMIASALAVDAKLIVADEPTTALDVTVQAGILREFRRINRVRKTSMLFISHDLGVVEALCDRVLVMKDGEVVESLSGDQLRRGDVTHPYTRMLLDAVPRLD